jgi:protein involved in polysaccharide export with SLBB domain
VPFSPGRLVIEGEENENLELNPGDTVTIFSQADIRVPQAQQVRVVRLEGEIRSAGVYTVRAGETLEQLVSRAGGLTPQAYIYGAEFMRESTRREQQVRLDRLLQDWDRELQQQGLQRTQKSISPDDAAKELADQEQARRLLERMRFVKATGRIVLGLERDQQDLKKLMELPLEDGDSFMVPVRPATINVLGAVYNQNAFLYEENLRVADYLQAAGGATRSADRDKVYICRADGSVVPRQRAGMFHPKFEETRLNPGDSLVVPEALPKTSILRGLRDWSQVLSQLVLGAAAINVLR